MIPNAAEIIRRRETAMFVLAIVGIANFFLGLTPLMLWVIEGLRDDDFWDLSYYLPQMVFTFVLMTTAAVFVFGRVRLAAWLIRPRPLQCPGCSYGLERLPTPRCPECGLVLTDEFLDQDDKVESQGE